MLSCNLMDIRWKNNRFEDLKDLVIMHRESETREDFIQSGKKEGGIKRTILLAQRIVESSVNFIQP